MSDLGSTICPCGHAAIKHHGTDGRTRRDAGCQTNTMRDDWCRCQMTCTEVILYHGINRGAARTRDEGENNE